MKMGIWGALKGAGEGVMANAKQRMEEQAAEKKSRIDEARERRLLEYQAQIAEKAREQSGEIESRLIGRRGEVQSQLQKQAGDIESGHIRERGAVESGVRKEADTRTLERQLLAQAHDSYEGAEDRKSAEKIAGMRSQGSLSEAEIKARERFEPRTSTIQTTGPDGIPRQEDVNTIYDKETRRTYIQQGNRFVPQGVDPATLRPAKAEAIDYLHEHPELATQFLEMYNYLPTSFMEMLPSERQR